uniref:Uncharacterized protein n=1 Tax=Tetranychus urticae TaxID=32264 RepID=T1JQ91_TETUR
MTFGKPKMGFAFLGVKSENIDNHLDSKLNFNIH